MQGLGLQRLRRAYTNQDGVHATRIGLRFGKPARSGKGGGSDEMGILQISEPFVNVTGPACQRSSPTSFPKKTFSSTSAKFPLKRRRNPGRTWSAWDYFDGLVRSFVDPEDQIDADVTQQAVFTARRAKPPAVSVDSVKRRFARLRPVGTTPARAGPGRR